MDFLDKENTSVSYDGVDMKIKRAFVKIPSQNIGEDIMNSDEILTNKNLIFEDSSDLPYGWSRFKERRLNSAHYDRCILTSCGTRIDRQKKLDEFISLKALDLNISFSGSGRESLAVAPVTTEQPGKRKLVQQGISSFMKTDSLSKKLKPNVVAVLETNEKTPDETSTLETDVDCDKKSSQDSIPSPSGGDDSVELTSETLEGSSNIVAAAVEIAPEVKEEKVINDLPPGWTRKQISKAFRKNETIIVVQTPDGKQFDCQKKLNSYIARNKLSIKVSIDGLFETMKSKEEPEVKPRAEEKTEVEEGDKKDKRKGKKERTAETDGALTNKEVDEDEVEELTKDELNYISEIKKFLKANKLPLSPTPPTKGDGNCWFRAVAEQVEFHHIPHKAKNYRSLRLEVRYFVQWNYHYCTEAEVSSKFSPIILRFPP